MEEDDDDFYGGARAEAYQQELGDDGSAAIKEEQMDVSEEQEEEEEDEDDVQFTLDKPADADPKPASRPPGPKPTASHDRTASQEIKQPPKPSTPAIKSETRPSAPPPGQRDIASKSVLTHAGKEGKEYPSVRTSSLDLDQIPLWPGNNKPITFLDVDADLAEHSKPWRLPGTDQTDFFNYGFDEYTWTQYCIKQQSMQAGINEQREADQRMKAMFGGGGGGPPGMPPQVGPPQQGGGGGGMPPDMEQMMQQMMAQGMNPGNMNFEQFMGMMGGPGGPGMPGGQQQQGMGPQGFGQGPQQGFGQQQQGGFGGGQGRQSASPAPGGQGGFQGPPQGVNTDGYSAQQLAIMQQGEQGMGGGGRGRNRRGRW